MACTALSQPALAGVPRRPAGAALATGARVPKADLVYPSLARKRVLLERELHAHVSLTKDWRLVGIPWTELSQSGHGTPVAFDARSLIGIDFAVLPEHTPFDFWIDDLSFTPAK